jgi:Na+-transporting NADH:ubiquinone oxidoreductase subunit E
MNEPSAWVILIASIFTNNILLSYFLGMCSFVACSRQIPTALGLGTAVTFVVTCTTIINWLLWHGVMVPLEIQHLQYIMFIAVIAAFVQFVEMFVERFSPKLYFSLGIFLPLITVNCAILGAALFMVIRDYSFIVTIGWGLGSGIGWFLAIMAMAGIRQRLALDRIPRGLQGPGITLIIAGLMALAFIGFSGVLQG